MNITFQEADCGEVNFIWVDVDQFAKLTKRLTEINGKTLDHEKFWTLMFEINKVKLSVYCNKPTCQLCKENLVDDWEYADLCAECYEEVAQRDAEDSARRKREDAYDESRGH